MLSSAEIMRLEELPLGIEALRAEAARDGFRFIEKLMNEWQSGANRFDAPGEVLIGAFQNESLVAVCGLNIDPYAGDSAVGRLRHLYVLKSARRQRLGSATFHRRERAQAGRTVLGHVDKERIGRHGKPCGRERKPTNSFRHPRVRRWPDCHER